MQRLLALILAIAIGGCSTQGVRSYGTVSSKAQNVSVQELLGNPRLFDGKEVRVVGVGDFDLGFEGVSAIYTSRDDLRHRTFSYISISSLRPSLRANKEAIEGLSGKFVLVEGVFHLEPKYWSTTLCFGACSPAGRLSNVNRIQAW